MTAILNTPQNHSEKVSAISRRAAETFLRLSWLTEAQAAVSWGVLFVLLAILLGIYLNQASQIAIIGRQLQQMQIELGDLQQANARLEREIAGSQKLEFLQNKAHDMGFVPLISSNIEYIVIPNYPVLTTPSSALQLVTTPEPIKTMPKAIWFIITDRVNTLTQGEAHEP